MRLFFSLGIAASSLALTNAFGNTVVRSNSRNYTSTCQTIAKSVSSASGVYYPGHPLYDKGNGHWSSISTQNSTCVVEPATAADVSTILKIVAKSSTPFGIRSGGHATNAGFSSTPGVQIALFKLSQIKYHAASQASDGSIGTVEIGAGLVWDDVYAALALHGATVVGGRVTGIGIGGFVLGGGYSWITNQYGLAIDTVTAFEVVLPNGKITTATKSSNSDLFFGLKGGFNNFGIVTKITMLAFPQGQVWGGQQYFAADQLPSVTAATLDFVKNETDPKAQIIVTYGFTQNQTIAAVLMFYDGPTPPSGIFKRFTSIPNIASDLSTRSMLNLIEASDANSTYGQRTSFNSVSLKTYSLSLLNQIQNQTTYWGNQGAPKGGIIAGYAVEPFLPSMTARSKGGAYPHDTFLMPMNILFGSQGAENDAFHIAGIKESTRVILDQAVAEGQDVGGAKQILYGNYALADAKLSSIYGPNVGRLRQIKKKYDPENVMRLAGGYRF